MAKHSLTTMVTNKLTFAGAGITSLSVHEGGGILAAFGGLALVALCAASACVVSRLQALSYVRLLGAYIFGAGLCQSVLVIAGAPGALGLLPAAALLVVGDVLQAGSRKLSERLLANASTQGE